MGKPTNKSSEKPKALGTDGVELSDLTCARCKKQKKNIQDGQYHCTYCGVLCENCAAQHQKTPKEKGHWAQKLQRVNQDKGPNIPTFKHVMKCETHSKHRIKGYCLDHGQLCCNECVKMYHGLCAVESLDTMSVGVTRDSHMLDAHHELADLRRRCKRISQANHREIDNMVKQASAFEEHVKAIRDKLNLVLDNMVTAIMRDKDTFCEAEAKLIEKEVKGCDQFEDILAAVANNLDDAFKGDEQTDMWVAVKKLESIITHYDEQVVKMESDKGELKLVFVPNKSLVGLLEAPENVGKVRITSSRLYGNSNEMVTQKRNMHVKNKTPSKPSETSKVFTSLGILKM